MKKIVLLALGLVVLCGHMAAADYQYYRIGTAQPNETVVALMQRMGCNLGWLNLVLSENGISPNSRYQPLRAGQEIRLSRSCRTPAPASEVSRSLPLLTITNDVPSAPRSVQPVRPTQPARTVTASEAQKILDEQIQNLRRASTALEEKLVAATALIPLPAPPVVEPPDTLGVWERLTNSFMFRSTIITLFVVALLAAIWAIRLSTRPTTPRRHNTP